MTDPLGDQPAAAASTRGAPELSLALETAHALDRADRDEKIAQDVIRLSHLAALLSSRVPPAPQ